MKISERVLSALNESPKTTREIQQLIPDKNARCIAATISNYPELFLRLDKGFVGLRNRDEHLVKDWKHKGLPLYKKLVNCLQDKPKTLDELYAMLPCEKRVSIRATATIYPSLFIRIKRGMIGRRNRDEHLTEQHKKKKAVKEKAPTIADMIEIILSDGAKTLSQINSLMPEVLRKSVSCKLSLNNKFCRLENGFWKLV